MASAKTQIADVIVPSIFEKYALERTAALSRFYQSGIVQPDPQFDVLAGGGGNIVDMPFWQDISGARQILSDTTALETAKIGASQDIARIHADGNAWSVNGLAGLLAGSDPMNAILNLVGEYWARVDQLVLIASLKGVFGAASMAGNLLSIAVESVGAQGVATRLNGSTFVDACAKLGDRADQLVAVAMHSAVEAVRASAESTGGAAVAPAGAEVVALRGRVAALTAENERLVELLAAKNSSVVGVVPPAAVKPGRVAVASLARAVSEKKK